MVPNPSGLNAHETMDSLAAAYAEPARAAGMLRRELAGGRVAVGDAVRQPGGVGEHRPELLLGDDARAEGEVAHGLGLAVGRAEVEVRGDRAVVPVEPLQQQVERSRPAGHPHPGELRPALEHVDTAACQRGPPLGLRPSNAGPGMSTHTW